MNYDIRFENVTVLGAAGKMGSGILLLTAMEMYDISMKPENKDKHYVLYALDISQKALPGLMNYVQDQLVRQGERKINILRANYKDRADLAYNSEIIAQYVKDVMSMIRPVTTIESAYESNIIFEAASENPELKTKMFAQINENSKLNPWFFTNTSSIPISFLNEKAKLEGRIIGVHFYNPPAVQKLVEVIKCDQTPNEMAEFVSTYIKNLRKIEVPSYDKAGFIGNGHFMRDALYGMMRMEELRKEMSFAEAVYTVNKVTQEFLIRPMGIFQLIDYVGIDVCQFIMKVMKPYVTDENIHSPLLDSMMEIQVKGGQNHDGSQKDGFLKYERGRIVAVWDLDKKEYVKLEEIATKCDPLIGNLPEVHKAWKVIVRHPNKNEELTKYFSALQKESGMGAKLAVEYQTKSKQIGEKLVSDKVAFTPEDVNTVLMTGFFHAYGPINDFIK
ncbi:MAG: 3-hydroxyacyl-CoA dehydrogenase family protein [Bacteroidales bacterium]|jgi:3-hydroxyacyl-CoA dehydrogenase|nr:3-hydroxyacyl-CoA dehydrogenase family protein [Bacteroidales bacterium]MCK9498785.1 3-hydroxyacyl-CoA dehydrogenase family protein [Bacteroidales bacterium]NLB86564.1 3-hydroxyacyl-CoA dehydrogenase family protein [Bacteroidales bacterium]